jgi:NAD(P)-dependent dehydrogenase (short-subunit alcohol dehydrogenase family)
MQNLSGKVAVITGAASGIGLAVARLCAAEGMRVVLADIEQATLDTVLKEFSENGHDAIGVVVDVSKYEDVERMAQATLDAFGKVHFLFNNAGVSSGSTVWETTLKDWEWVMGVNVMGVIYGVKVFTPIMLAQTEEAHIVNTASIAGLIAGPSMGAYRVSKHAVVALSETLYLELEQNRSKIGVSVLCPAWVKTRIFESERNRPKDAQNDISATIDPIITAQLQAAQHAVQHESMPPEQIAEHVLDAIRENRFYILTHPKFTGAVAYRMKDILNGGNPRNLMQHS